MPFLLCLVALFTPGLVVALLFFFTQWLHKTFDSLLWLIPGFIFLPTTLLWYTAVQHWFGGQWTLWPLVGIVIAIVIDVSPAGSRRRDFPPSPTRLGSSPYYSEASPSDTPCR